ncbi:hypothetical protein Moror_8619 [Moniliophthora roreri MCA 2997]|uniref:Uncharacterized protein n=1 Tax=Moniliophthora roreri (strain MCA 2997) TaxID=1381753 RepID=V2WS48_MONRO|nr:hypothetical protein Moror_8619 [Moniliophthora roreri MCA 2997]
MSNDTSNPEITSVKDGSYNPSQNNYITENFGNYNVTNNGSFGSIESYDFGFSSDEDEDEDNGEDWKSRPPPPPPQESGSDFIKFVEWDTRWGSYPDPPDDNFLIPNAWIRNGSQGYPPGGYGSQRPNPACGGWNRSRNPYYENDYLNDDWNNNPPNNYPPQPYPPQSQPQRGYPSGHPPFAPNFDQRNEVEHVPVPVPVPLQQPHPESTPRQATHNPFRKPRAPPLSEQREKDVEA